MLHVQNYLSSKSYDDLATELGIRITRHETDPLVILNYDQIESPKLHPVVKECRGLVLNSNDNSLVARSFSRFFNWGEVQDEMKNFDFSDFSVAEKVDGSLVILYYFGGRWRANTRGSFGIDTMQFQRFTWQEGICQALGVSDLSALDKNLDSSLTYVCEFVSPWNKVVRSYSQPKMYLLAVFEGENELNVLNVDALAECIHDDLFDCPQRYEFHSIEEVQDFLNKQGEEDPTFEGVVLRDKNNARWKIKSATYLGLHRLKGDGDNLYNPKNLIPFILAGEDSELLTYFPEVLETYEKYKAQINESYMTLEKIFNATQGIDNQKEYALSIVGKTPYTGLLFNLRKEHGPVVTVEQFKKAWRNAADTILKCLFK